MQNNYLKDKFVVIVLLGVSVFLGIMILVKVRGFFVALAWAENVVKRAVAQSEPDANDVKEHLAKSKTIAEELKKKNLFAPPPPKKHPVSQVSGILGDEVLINDKWYKVGDKIGDAKIVAIEPAQVKIEWESKEKVFAPINAATAPTPTKKIVKKPTPKKVEPAKVAAAEKPVEEKVAAAPAEEDPLAWMGVELSPKVRKMLLKQWNKASDEEKEKAKEEWNKMSDEQKQQAVDAMEQMPDSMSIEEM